MEWGLCRLVESRADLEGGRAAEIPRVSIIMRTTAMHSAAVVPDYEITDPPFVAVDEFGPGRLEGEVVE